MQKNFSGCLIACVLAFLASHLTADGAEPAAAAARIPHNQDAPPGPPLSPAEAVARMTVPPGFQVEIVAAEPDLVNPVAMAFDDRGRVWVTESLEYPRLEPGPGSDRVKIMEDTDADGRMDKFTIFAEGLNIPSGIAIGHGGVWVANAPDILFLRDTDGDDRADTREVVVTGFGREDTHELPNSLTWGPDGWLYGLNGVFNRSTVVHQGKTHVFTCALWRLHPHTREFELFAEGTSNPWGVAWDTEGSAFVSACVIDHLWHLTESGYYHRQAGAYPPHTWKIESIVAHSHQKAAYCGLHYFDSDAYPPEFRDRLYMGNIHGAAINVDSLRRNGSTYIAEGHDDLLQAHDTWFMPIVQKTGPDGCLYVLDWYDRYHCYQDARRDPEGIDRLKGRLYRVRYQQSPRAPAFDLAAETEDQLVARLASPNVYFRDAAQRILSQRQNPAATARLKALVFDKTVQHKTRMHALWAWIGAGTLDADSLGRLLNDEDPSLRAWGVRAAGNTRTADSRILAKLQTMADDPAPDVRLQLAIAAGKVDGPDSRKLLVDVLARSGDDPLIPRIVWRNLRPLLDEHEAAVAQLFDRFPELPSGVILLAPRVVDYWLADNHPSIEPVAETFQLLITQNHSPQAAAVCLDRVAERITNRSLPEAVANKLRAVLDPHLGQAIGQGESSPLYAAAVCLAACWKDPPALDAALRLLGNVRQPESRRLQALSALVTARHEPLLAVARPLLESADAPTEFRRQLVSALAGWEDDRVRDLLLVSAPRLDPLVQSAAILALSERRGWAKSLLDSIARKELPREALNENQVRRLLRYSDPELTKAVSANWGTLRAERNPDREVVIKRVRAMLTSTPGDPHNGVKVFQKACAPCHRIHGSGEEVGPDLTRNGRNSWDQLLSNVLDPSLVIGADYQAVIIVTSDGRSFTGLELENSDEQVVLKLQGGKTETISRGEIEEMETLALSLMPEGVERQLSEQELADLMAFLALDRPPDDPAARRLDGAPVLQN